MEDRDAPDRRPAGAGLGRDRVETGDDGFVVGLVGQVLDAVAPIGVVAYGAAEQDDGAAAGAHGPGVRLGDRQLVGCQRQPVITGRGREHGPHRSPGTRTAIRRREARPGATSLRWAPSLRCAPVDRAPLPPHERPWRHPSELGPPAPEPTSTSGRVIIATAATLSLLLIGLLAVSMTPDNGGSPQAVASTTSGSHGSAVALEQPRVP